MDKVPWAEIAPPQPAVLPVNVEPVMVSVPTGKR